MIIIYKPLDGRSILLYACYFKPILLFKAKTQKVIPTFVLSYQNFLTQHSSIFLLQIHSLVFVTIYVVQILSY